MSFVGHGRAELDAFYRLQSRRRSPSAESAGRGGPACHTEVRRRLSLRLSYHESHDQLQMAGCAQALRSLEARGWVRAANHTTGVTAKAEHW